MTSEKKKKTPTPSREQPLKTHFQLSLNGDAHVPGPSKPKGFGRQCHVPTRGRGGKAYRPCVLNRCERQR